MALDWDKIAERAGVPTGASLQSSNQPSATAGQVSSPDPVAMYKEFAKSRPKAQPKAPEPSLLDKASAVGKAAIAAPLRGLIDTTLASRLDAFGQFELADELRGFSAQHFPKQADIPEFGEAPSAGFLAEALGENAPDMAATVAVGFIPFVGLPLAGGMIYSSLYGESRREILEKTGQDNPLAAVAPATFGAALEFGHVGRILDKVGVKNIFSKLYKDKVKVDASAPLTARLKDIGAFATGTAVRESLIETAQWAANATTVRVLTDKEIFSKLSSEDKNEAWASFWGGFGAGAGIGAGAAAYGQYKAKDVRDQVEKQVNELEAISNEIQARAATVQSEAQVKSREAIRAGLAQATVNPEDATVTPASQQQSSATVPASQPAAPQPVPVTSESIPQPTQEAATDSSVPDETGLLNEVFEAKQEKIKEIADVITALPEADKQQALAALEAQLALAKEQLAGLNIALADGAASYMDQGKGFIDQSEVNDIAISGDDSSVINNPDRIEASLFNNQLSEPNFKSTARLRAKDLPYSGIVPENVADPSGIDPLKRVDVIEGQIVKSSIQREGMDIDLTDGLMVLTDSDQALTAYDIENANAVWSLIKDLGLDINPDTKSPMRMFFEFRKDMGNADGAFAVWDGTTYVMRVADVARQNLDKYFKTIIHELGHLLAIRSLNEMTVHQRALLYREWSKDIGSVVTRGQMFDRFMPGYAQHHSRKTRIRKDDRENYGITSYPTSLSEYLAEQFALALSNAVTKGNFNLKSEMPSVYQMMNRYSRTAYVKSMKSFGTSPEATGTAAKTRFQQFVDRMLLGKRVVDLQARIDQMKKAEKIANEKDSKDAIKDAAPVKEVIEVTQGETYNFPSDSDAAKVVDFLGKAGLNKQAQNLAEVIDINMGFIGNNLRGKVSRKLLTPLQMAEQAGKRGFHLGTAYIEEVQKMQATKMKMLERADTFLREWQSFGTDGATRIAKLAYEVSTKSDELGRRLTSDEITKYTDSLRLTPEEIAAWKSMDTIFNETVDSIEAGMVYDAAKTYIKDKAQAKEFRDRYMAESDPDARNQLIEDYTGVPLVGLSQTDPLTNPLWDSLSQIKNQTDGMRNKNYFPRSRMGEYSVKITANKGQTWEGYTAKKDGETVGFYSFDTSAEAKAFLKEIAPDMGNGFRAIEYKMDSQVFSVMGLPAGIIEQIKREVPNLSATQLAQLDDIAMQRSPGRKFLRHLTKRRGIAGYSQDAMRVFANYMSSSANHLARTEHSSDIAAVIAEMDSQIKTIPGDAVAVEDLNVIRDYFVKHFDYLMKPDSDWARLRAVGFLWYLGFNVKSAAVNLMQTPMVLYPVLSAHTSDANAVRRITGAMRDAVSHIRTGKKLTGGELAAIDEMIKLGLIDQSFATELAGMAEADALKRLIPGWDMKQTLDKVSWYGGALFRMGEKFNRYVSAIAAYRVAMDNNLSQEDAIKFVRDTIQGSQFEYSRWNRAEFMRGKKSVLFLFWQYMQHASYLAFGGKGSKTAQRMWILALVIAGIEGLPFAEMIFGILDFSGTQVNKLLGKPNPRVALREDIRELITSIYDRPDDIMKGLSYQYGLGPLHALGLLGIPVPEVSTRGSLSYGNPVPWFEPSLNPTTTSAEALYAKTFASVAGPVGGMFLSVVEAMMSKEVDQWKRWEKVLPTFMQNASTGVRWRTREEETNTAQASLLTFETPEQRAETVVKMLGFQPTRVDQTRQQVRAAQVPILLAQAKREALLKQLDYAVKTKNREGKKDVLDAIRAYNAEMRKEKEMRPYIIQADTIRSSLSGRAKRRAEMEKGIRHGKDGIMLERKIEKLYPVTAGE